VKHYTTGLCLLCSLMNSPLYAQSVDDLLNKGKNLLATVDTKKVGLTDGEISEGLKQALEKGASSVIAQLSSVDGFNQDADIHIPLPKNLNKLNKVLKKMGYSQWTEDLELKLNRAAELATPQAETLLLDAIKAMEIEDIKEIYQGNDDAATQYFQSKMSEPLKLAFTPIIESSLNEVGAIQLYEKMVSKYQSVPFVPDIKGDLSAHVIDKGLSGIFYYLAKEEMAIRQDPLKQSTALLKKLFSK
jgi:hypothetical protein